MNLLLQLASAPTALALLFLLQGCGADSASEAPAPSATTSNSSAAPAMGSATLSIVDAQLSSDPGGQNVTTTFKPSDHTVYIKVSLSGAGNGAKVRLVWTQVDGGNVQNKIFSEKEVAVDGEGNTVRLNVAYDADWPVGTYKTEIYLNGNLEKTLNWTVR